MKKLKIKEIVSLWDVFYEVHIDGNKTKTVFFRKIFNDIKQSDNRKLTETHFVNLILQELMDYYNLNIYEIMEFRETLIKFLRDNKEI